MFLIFITDSFNFWCLAIYSVFNNCCKGWLTFWLSNSNCMTSILVVCHSYCWSEAIFTVLTFIAFRTFDVSCWFPCIVLLNEDIACFSINEAVSILTLACFWIYLTIENFFTITSCWSLSSISPLNTLFTFVTFWSFDVAFFLPTSIVFNEYISTFSIYVFISVFTFCCWIYFSV